MAGLEIDDDRQRRLVARWPLRDDDVTQRVVPQVARIAGDLRRKSTAVDLANTVYALDATIVNLCLSVFPWAHYRRRDAAIKLHTQLDLRGSIPTVVQIRRRQ